MRLAEFTDYTLRVLMYCAAHPEERITISALAEGYGISKNHLMKVVNDLARQGLLETTRGRGGGLRLIKDPTSIHIGDVVQAAETDFRMAECFDAATNRCALTPRCGLKQLLESALQSYFDTLNNATLADIAQPLTLSRRASSVAVLMPFKKKTLPRRPVSS